MVERGAVRAAIHDWLNAWVRSGERFKEFPGLSGGCFIIADYHFPIGKRLRKYAVDSTAQHRQTSVGWYRDCDKGHPRFSDLRICPSQSAALQTSSMLPDRFRRDLGG